MSQEKLELKLDSIFDGLYDIGSDGLPIFKMYISGDWRHSGSGRTQDIRSPIDGSLLARVSSAGKEEVSVAVRSAFENRHKIRDIPAIERIEIFREADRLIQKYRNSFVQTLVAESGKPQGDADGEVGATISRMNLTMEDGRKIFGEYIPGDWAEDTLGKIALVLREPIGVVAAISPFNYPLFLMVSKIVPALLSGNAVVAKPPGNNPLASLLFAKLLEESQVPEGVLQVLTGRGGEIGDELVSDDRVGMVSFTGSTAVGRQIASLAGIKKHHLELGGKGAAIVLEDCDLDLAAERCVAGSFKNAGQRCDAISIVYVVEGIADMFVSKAVERAGRWKAGDPRDPSVSVGPLIDIKAAERVQALVDNAVSAGALLLKGGGHRDCFFEPTVIDRVPLSARIASEETFGPVLTIVRVRDEDEALEIANRSMFGLDSCVFTNSFYKIWKISKRLQTGEVTVNDFPRHGVGIFPFGGWKDSGVGREGIGYTIEEMTNLKTITFNMEPAGLGKTKHVKNL
jgi:glyceraldehyde-3-phosphate dehydrogenase [NAD(P)+]